MADRRITVYYGQGRGKSAAALGAGLKASAIGKSTIMISFLKGKCDEQIMDYCKTLNPEIKFFTFEKGREYYEDLDEDAKADVKRDIMNGLAYTRKVLSTGECQMLILDEALGLIDEGVIDATELINMLHAGIGEADIIITGRKLPDEIREAADAVYMISTDKE